MMLLFSVGTVADFALALAIVVVAIGIPVTGVALVVAADAAEAAALNIAMHRTTSCVNPKYLFPSTG